MTSKVSLYRKIKVGLNRLLWITLLFIGGCSSAKNGSATSAISAIKIPQIEITPFPDFVFYTWPYPGEVKTIEVYRKLFPPGIATQPSVCLSLVTYYMVEADVHLTVEDVLNQMSLKVNERVFTKPYYLFYDRR